MAKRRDEVVRIYEGLTALDAQELADRLNQAGIESFVDNTDSPVEGLVVGRQGKIVKVFRADLEAAQRIKRAFERDGHVGAPRDAGIEEEAEGMELSSDQRPSQDSPSNDIEGAGVERLDMSQPGAEAPEVEGLQLEEPGVPQEDVPASMIKGFGADRPLAMDPDVETDEIEDQQIDRLDVTPTLRERETATPAANLKGRMGVRTRGTAEQPAPRDAGTNDASERRGAVTRRPGGGVRATRSTSRTKRTAKSRSGGGKAQKQLREASKKQGGGRKSTRSSSSTSGKRMGQEERSRVNPERNASRRTAERGRTKRG